MEASITKGLAATIVASITYLVINQYLKCREAFKYWNKLGILGPKPLPIIGHTLNIFFGDKVSKGREWFEKFGPCYGIYEGTIPRLVIVDPEVTQQICIKDFDVFPNNDLESTTNYVFGLTVFCLKDDDWRRVRSSITPSFTSAKIKQMFELVNECADELLKEVDLWVERSGKPDIVIDGKNFASLFSISTICKCCYGLKVKIAGAKTVDDAAKSDRLIATGLYCFKVSVIGLFGRIILPKMICNKFDLDIIPLSHQLPMLKIIKSIVNNRRQMKNSEKPCDFLQSMIDCRESSIDETEDVKQLGPTKKSAKMSEAEMLSQAVFLMLAGLETSSNLIAKCMYVLAHHMSIQEKLFKELGEISIEKPDGSRSFEYDTLMSYDYLEACINETLRLFPVLNELTRVANRDYYIKKLNVTVPKGTIIDMHIHQLGLDPNYWQEPEKIKPERFMPENKHLIVPGSYGPFGLGPRQCLGMRFAITEIKVILAKLIMEYKLMPAPGSSFSPGQQFKSPFLRLKSSVVQLCKR